MLTACGGGNSKEDTVVIEPPPPMFATFSLGVSDAPVDNAEEVVITIDSVTFKGDGLEDAVFDTFNNEAEGIVDADTVTIDLLQFQGSAQLTILEGAEIPVGQYNQTIISVIDQDVELSYVTELGGAKKPIKVPSDNLKLGGISFEDSAENQALTVEFSLRKSLTYKPGPDEYNLKPTGVRIVDASETGTIVGIVDIDTINQDISCIADTHLIYLYQGIGLNSDNLADSFDTEQGASAPDNAIAPFDTVAPSFDNDSNSYRYEFGFIPVGDYTLAYACNTGENGDEPDDYDGITIPNPVNQLTEVNVAIDTETVQDFPIL